MHTAPGLAALRRGPQGGLRSAVSGPAGSWRHGWRGAQAPGGEQTQAGLAGIRSLGTGWPRGWGAQRPEGHVGLGSSLRGTSQPFRGALATGGPALTLAGPVCLASHTVPQPGLLVAESPPSGGGIVSPGSGAWCTKSTCLSAQHCLPKSWHRPTAATSPCTVDWRLEAGKHWAARSTEGLDSPSSLHMDARLPCRSYAGELAP